MYYKKMIKHDKYYKITNCVRRYHCRSIPINNRFPVGTLELEDTEEDRTSMVHAKELQSAVIEVDELEYYDDNIFDLFLIQKRRACIIIQVTLCLF